jgi:hypothetical protein
MRRIALGFLLLSALTSCAAEWAQGGHGPTTVAYNAMFVRGMANRGDIPTELHGNPSGLADQGFADLLRRDLRLTQPFPDRALDVRYGPFRGGEGFRVVLVFNPSEPNVQASDMCGNKPIPTKGRQTQMYVLSAFCRGPIALSTFSSRVQTPESFDAPMFRKMRRNLMHWLMPPALA